MTSGLQPRRLTSPEDLVEAGLAEPERLQELEAVAKRYAIGLTPALAALVRARTIPPTRSRVSSCPILVSSSAILPSATIRLATTP